MQKFQIVSFSKFQKPNTSNRTSKKYNFCEGLKTALGNNYACSEVNLSSNIRNVKLHLCVKIRHVQFLKYCHGTFTKLMKLLLIAFFVDILFDIQKSSTTTVGRYFLFVSLTLIGPRFCSFFNEVEYGVPGGLRWSKATVEPR